MFRNFNFRRQFDTKEVLSEIDFIRHIELFNLYLNSNRIFYGIDMVDDVITDVPIHVVYNYNSSLAALSAFDDLYHLQILDMSIFCTSERILLKVLSNVTADQFFEEKMSEKGKDIPFRIIKQVDYVLRYINEFNVYNPLIVDFGAGDSDLSDLLSVRIKRYVKLDPKFGHSDEYISRYLSNVEMDAIILVRNVSHHIDNFDVLNFSNASNILVIDWFGYNQVFGSIYHWVYKEGFLFRDFSRLRVKLSNYQSISILDDDGGPHPCAMLFHKMKRISALSTFTLDNFSYDVQFMNSDCTLQLINYNDVNYGPGMLRGIQDYFFPSRFLTTYDGKENVGGDKISLCFNLIEKVKAVESFVAYNREVRADDIYMWLNIIESADALQCVDPFSGWFSRGLAFALCNWHRETATFYWYDIDDIKVLSTTKLISYLTSSGCKCKFEFLTTYTDSKDVVLITSPFYMNFESVSNRVNKFSTTDEWAKYVLYFMKTKAPLSSVSYIMVSDYKGYNMLNSLNKMLGESSLFSVINDLIYFQAVVDVLYTTGRKSFDSGLFNNVKYSYMYEEYVILGERMKLYERCMLRTSTYTLCGHLATPSFYSDQFSWHCGQLKLAYLLIDFVSQFDLDCVIYLGSGSPASILTNKCINILSPFVKFILVDKYYVTPQNLKSDNIVIFNDFVTLNNAFEICDLSKGYKNIGILSDIRKGPDVVHRGSEFESELPIYFLMKDYITWGRSKFCLKINYCTTPYHVPKGDLVFFPFISSELRLITDLDNKILEELPIEKFDKVMYDGYCDCFQMDEYCKGCQIIKSLEALM